MSSLRAAYFATSYRFDSRYTLSWTGEFAAVDSSESIPSIISDAIGRTMCNAENCKRDSRMQLWIVRERAGKAFHIGNRTCEEVLTSLPSINCVHYRCLVSGLLGEKVAGASSCKCPVCNSSSNESAFHYKVLLWVDSKECTHDRLSYNKLIFLTLCCVKYFHDRCSASTLSPANFNWEPWQTRCSGIQPIPRRSWAYQWQQEAHIDFATIIN